MNGFVYKWYDKNNGMIYIGSHEGTFDDEFICDSPDMLWWYKKRPYDFVRTILWQSAQTNPKQLKEKETYYLFLRNPAEMFGGSYRKPFEFERKITFTGEPIGYDTRNKVKAPPDTTAREATMSRLRKMLVDAEIKKMNYGKQE